MTDAVNQDDYQILSKRIKWFEINEYNIKVIKTEIDIDSRTLQSNLLDKNFPLFFLSLNGTRRCILLARLLLNNTLNCFRFVTVYHCFW